MLHDALRLIRVFHDLKQFELANRLGVSRSYISEIEKGTKSPSLELLDKYAVEFGIPRSSILFFAEQLPGAKRGDAARRSIASKVIDILKFIEKRSDVEDAPV
jgi:transcriptional regulator with XRE-family HTH domain